MSPGLALIRGPDDAAGVGGGWGAVGGDDDVVLHQHVGGFKLRVEQQGVLRGIRDVGRCATEDAAVVTIGDGGAVGVGDPDDLVADEVDAARFEAGVGVHGDEDFPIPGVCCGVVGAAQPVDFFAVAAVDVASAGVEGVFGGVEGDVVNVASDHGIVGLAKQRGIRWGTFLLEVRILTAGVGKFDGLALVGGIVNVHGHSAAHHVAVVAPDQHFFSSDLEAVLAIKRVEVPTGSVGIDGGVGKVVATIGVFDDDFAMGLEAVGAEEKALAGSEEDVAVGEEDAEGDVLGFSEIGRVRPGFAAVFREHDLVGGEREGLVVALGVDVRAVEGWHAVVELFGFADDLRRVGAGETGEKQGTGGGEDLASSGHGGELEKRAL